MNLYYKYHVYNNTTCYTSNFVIIMFTNNDKRKISYIYIILMNKKHVRQSFVTIMYSNNSYSTLPWRISIGIGKYIYD